jgi:hypothetical protein
LIQEIQDKIRGAKWFIKLNITNAYYHIRIAEGEEWKTAFRSKFRLYKYLVMPFRLTNAPPGFQQFINKGLAELIHQNHVVMYINDILIFNKTKEELVQWTTKVLERLKELSL